MDNSLAYLQGCLDRSLNALRVEPPLRCSEWAAKHWLLSNESSPQPGPFRAVPYQIGLLDISAHDNIPTVVVQKSARVGYTTINTILTAYFHIHKARNTITYNPNDELASEHMQARIKPAVRDVPILERYTSGLGTRKVAKSLNLNNGTILRSLGGASANNYRAKDADVVIFDELDALPTNLGEGDPVYLGRMRTMASPRPKLIMGTTPLISGESLVESNMASADLRLTFKVLCPSCGSRESIEWGGADGVEGLVYEAGKPETASWICPNCQSVHGYEYQRTLVQSGRWESKEGTYWNNGEFLKATDSGCEVQPLPRSVGLFIWSAYNPRQQWSEICRVHHLSGNDREKIQAFENTWLGKFFKQEVITIEPDPLYRRREEYSGVPADVLCITAGIDVQKDRLEAHFVGWGVGAESWSLAYRIYMGDPVRNEVWEDLYGDLEEGLPLEDDGAITMPVIQALVDSGYHTMEVYAQVRSYGERILMACKGMSTVGAPLVSVPKVKDKEHKVRIVRVGVNNGKDTLYSRLAMEEAGAGFVHFPISESHDYEFFRQLTSEEKIKVKRGGRMVYTYEQIKGLSNEVLDTSVYALAAFKVAERKGRTKSRITMEGGGRIKSRIGKRSSSNADVVPVRKKSSNFLGL